MRHVTLILRHLDGSPWAGADLLYQLIPGGSYSASTQYPARQVQDVTNASGLARTPLWENAAAIAPCLIRLWLPNDAFLDFTLPVGGGDVSLMSLLSPPGGGAQGVRSVEGRIGQLTDAGWPGAPLTFELESLSYTAEAIYPPDSIQAIADGAGLISQVVWANGGGSVRSRLKITDPEGDFYYCQIPAGSGAVTLSSLRAAAQEPRSPISPTPLPPQTTVPLAALEGLIAAHNADVVAHPGGIAGSGGGGGIKPVWEAFSWGDASPALIGAPITGFIHSVAIAISAVFPPGTALSLGVVGQPALFATIPASEVGSYEFYPAQSVASAQPILTISVPPGTTAGAGSVFIHYTS
jgi:hypothetical protein